MSDPLAQSVSPVCTEASLATATMSPASAASASSCLLPLRVISFPIFSDLLSLSLTSSMPPVSFPPITFMTEIFPTNGSAIVLNTNAEGAAPASTGSAASSGERPMPTMKSRMASAGCPSTNGVLHTGTMLPSRIPPLRPCLISASVNSSPSKYFSISSSSDEAMASMRSSSMSVSGHASGVIPEPNFPFSASIAASTSAPPLSAMTMMRGVPVFSQALHAFSVPTWTGFDPSTRIIAVSAALSAALTSPAKSKNPGVSMKLIFVPFHSMGIIDVLMEYPFSISILS